MIRVNNMSYQYPGVDGHARPYALRDVTLDIASNEYIAFLGPNGSGKSTMARLLNGLYVPSEGTIHVDDMEVSEAADKRTLRRKVQLVFQNPESQLVGLTLEEDIAFGLSNIGYPASQMKERITWALELVGMAGRGGQHVHALSGGEKQKLALASTLALSPQYLIMDEATSMLDPMTRRLFLVTLQAIRKHSGFCLVFITHHLEEILDADRIILFKDGTIRGQFSPANLLEHTDLLEECGIELPFIPTLSAKLHHQGISVPSTFHKEELADHLCKLF